jgi:hypothetical protein
VPRTQPDAGFSGVYDEWVRDHHAGFGHMRASDADRERTVGFLKAAFVQGRLSQSELMHRVGQALVAKTYAQLAAAADSIPAEQGVAVPVPAQARPVNWKVIAWVLSLVIVLPGLGVAFFATYYGSFYILVALGFLGAGWLGSLDSPGHRRRRAY